MGTSKRIAAALLALLAGACADATPPRTWRRVVLERVAAGARPEPVRVRTLTVPAGGGSWRVEGEGAGVDGAGGGAARVRLDGTSASVALPARAAAGTFDEVVLRGTFPRGAWLGLRLTGPAGELERAREAQASPGPQIVRFDVGRSAITRGGLSRARLVVSIPGGDGDGGAGAELRALELWRRPPAAGLPDAESGPGWIDVEGDARRGVALAPGEVLGAALEADRGEVVELFVARLADAPEGTVDAPLRVALERGGERTVREHASPTGGWTRLRADVPPGRGPVALRVSSPAASPAATGARAGAWAVAGPAVGRPDPAARTVLLVVSDTHRADHLGAAGSDVAVATPALDALAARGVLFEDCWSTTNITKPSHAALFTGVHPRDSRMVHNGQTLAGDARTLAEEFADAGFATWAAVSIEFLAAGESGLGQGFDRVVAPATLWKGGETVERLLAGAEDADGRPLFVWLHLFDAHTPYAPPGEFDRRYYPADRDPRDPALPATGIPARCIPAEYADVRDLEYPRAQYRAEVDYLDAALAPVLRHPRLGAGVVAFTADHGEVFEAQGSYFNHAVLLPDTLHVPLVLAGPGVPAGRRVERPVELVDLGRTLLDLAGLEDRAFPGRSLLEDAPAAAPRFALASNGWSASVTHEGWHLVLHLRDHAARFAEPKRAHAVELFDRSAGADGHRDVAAGHPDVVRRLRAALVAWLLEARDLGLGERPPDSAARRARLAELGYVVEADAAPAGSAWIDPDCGCPRCAPWDRAGR